jgi:hypothetical protein
VLAGPVAQWLERRTHNPLVVGSNPTGPTNFGEKWSGRRDLNPRPLGPEPSALAKLRYVPNPTSLLNHTFWRARKNSITIGKIDKKMMANSTIPKWVFTHGSPPNQ